MNENTNEDRGYQVFSNLMDAVFELCEELNDKVGLTNAEAELLDAMDEYVANVLEEDAEEIE